VNAPPNKAKQNKQTNKQTNKAKQTNKHLRSAFVKGNGK
jgi:hypothetical protein